MSVFVHHLFQQYFDTGGNDIWSAIFRQLGVWGVAVFFGLSGFCIHWARISRIERSGTFLLREYASKRFRRIYPAFTVCVVLSFLLSQLRSSNLLPQSTFQSVLSHLVLVSNFFPDYRTSVNNVLWSVILEVHFYLLYGMIWREFSDLNRSIRTALIAAAIGAITYLVSVTELPQGAMRVTLQHTLPALFWTWCLGALVAQIWRATKFSYWKGASLWMWLIWSSSIAICLLPFSIALQFDRITLPILTTIGLYLALKSRSHFLESKYLIWIGTRSYSMYLFHPLAIWLFIDFST